MKDLMERLRKAVSNLAETTETTEVVEETTDESSEMSVDEFMGYVTDQVEKAAADSPEVRAMRLKALADQIEVAKNFQGPTPGKISVKAFKDPAQIVPKTQEAKTSNATPTTAMTAGPPAQPAGNPTTPSGGKLPPQTAGGSGFSTPAAATFAKSMETIQGALAELAPETETETAPKTEVTKASAPIWPLDMNTPFGRGDVDDDTTPEWGFDPKADTEAAE